MFNLVKYRLIFIGLSLLIIVPGFISLVIFRLNVGIDFLGGSDVQFRPQSQITTDVAVTNLLKPLKLQDVQINLGQDSQMAANKIAWVRLNTQIDGTVQGALRTAISKVYPQSAALIINFQDVPQTNGKTFTLVTITGFQNVPSASVLQAALSKLPNTTSASATSTSSTATPVATSTVKATSTPQATATVKATATAKAAATTKATGTVVATATTASTSVITPTATPNPAANIPVSVQDVKIGTTTQTITILTRSTIQTADLAKIQQAFLNGNGPYVYLISNNQVGPSVAGDTQRNAVLAVIAASLFILLYIWFSFRKIPKAFRYGTCAIVAMLHDVLVVLGVFSILGVLFHIQIDALFITALLTVIGFSVHDTIVVFDRIRENLHRRTTETFEQVVNASLVQTMARSLNTSLTVLFTLLALTLFTGIGTSIHTFTLTLLIGIFSGTYSSIFNASMLLVMWDKGELSFRRKREQDRQIGGRESEERQFARSRG